MSFCCVITHTFHSLFTLFQLSLFWTISAIQLIFLAKTLPQDEDKMTAELAAYAASLTTSANTSSTELMMVEDEPTTIEDRISTWDAAAARESMEFFNAGFKEIRDEIQHYKPSSLIMNCSELRCVNEELTSSSEDNSDVEDEETVVVVTKNKRRSWQQQQREESSSSSSWRGELPDETTPLFAPPKKK